MKRNLSYLSRPFRDLTNPVGAGLTKGLRVRRTDDGGGGPNPSTPPFKDPEIPAGLGALYLVTCTSTSISTHFSNQQLVGTTLTFAPLTTAGAVPYKLVPRTGVNMWTERQSGAPGNFRWLMREASTPLITAQTQALGANSICSDPNRWNFVPTNGVGQTFDLNASFNFYLTDENFGSGTVCGKRSFVEFYVRFLNTNSGDVTTNPLNAGGRVITLELIEDYNP